MSKQVYIKIIRELLWWTFSIIVAYIILHPILDVLYYKYLLTNLLFILLFITYFRYIIFFKEILLFRNKWVRIAIFLLNIHLFIVVLANLQLLTVLLDTFSLDEFASGYKIELSQMEQARIWKYMYREIVATAVGSLIMIIGINIRILVSYFRKSIRSLNSMMNS